jgi:hypothetical protein
MKLLEIIATTLFVQGALSQNHSMEPLKDFHQCHLPTENISQLGIVNPKGAWIDIPISEYALPKDPIFTEVKGKIDYYHTIPAIDRSLLPKRIDSLQRILSDMQHIDLASSPHLNTKAEKFNVLAKKKLWYLREIQSLYDEADPYQKYIDISQTQEGEIPLLLVNKLAFDPNLPMYWGFFLLETLDPCHRFLTQYYLKWEKGHQGIPFFLWLEDQEILFNTFQIDYFTDLERVQHQINIIDGYLYKNSDGQRANFNAEDKEYLFSITMNKELIVVEGSEHVRHTTLSCGEPTLGSGTLKIENGVLTYIDTESGHYQPSPHSLKQVFRILQTKGLLIDPSNVNVKYYTTSGVINESASMFLEKYAEECVVDSKSSIENIRTFFF